MKNSTKAIAAVIGLLTVLLQAPAVQSFIAGTLAAHPNAGAIVSGIAAIAALLHQPQESK